MTALSPRKGSAPGQHLVEDDADRVEVGALVDGLALGLFGRQVLGRAQNGAGLGHLRVVGLGDAEVGDLHRAGGVDQDVLRLDVAVHDVRAVGHLHRGKQLEGYAHRLARGVATLAADVVLERLALDVLHDDVVGAVDRAPVVDVDDVGVVDAGRGLGFAAEALDELLVAGVALEQHLDRDAAAQRARLRRGRRRPCRRRPAGAARGNGRRSPVLVRMRRSRAPRRHVTTLPRRLLPALTAGWAAPGRP